MTWKIRSTKRGQRSPPPLPMYERVVLKHVPTIVRRRYDKDLNIIPDSNNNQGLPSEDGKSDDDGDGVEEFDDSFDDEEEENFGGSTIESSTISCLKDCEDDESVENELHEVEQDCKSKGEGAEDGNVASYHMNVSVQGESQDKEHESFEDKQGVSNSKERKDEDDEVNEVTAAYYGDTSATNKVQDNEKGFHVVDDKIKCDGAEDGVVASNHKVDIVEDEVQDIQHYNFDDKQENCESEGDGIKDDNGASSYVDGNIKDEVQNKEQENFHENNEKEKLTGSFGKDTTTGAHSPTPLPMYKPVPLKHVPTFVVRKYDKDIHKFGASPGFLVEDNKSKGGETEEKSVADVCEVDVVEDEVQGNQHANFDNKEVTCGKDSTTGGKSPTPLPMYEPPVPLNHVPTFVVKRYEKDIRIGSSQGLKSEESKSEEGVEYSSNATPIDVSVEDRKQVHMHAKLDANDQGFLVEDNKSKGGETEERSVADVCEVDVVEDEVQGNQHAKFDNKEVTCGKDSTTGGKSPTPLPMYEPPVPLNHVPTFVVKKYEKDIRIGSSQGLKSEESKSEEGVEYSSNATPIDVSVEDRKQVHRHAKLDANDQGLYLKNIEEEEDGTEEGNLASYLDTPINYEVENNEQGLHVEVCKREDARAKDINNASYDVEENAKYQENLEKAHENFGNEQVTCGKDSTTGGKSPTPLPMYEPPVHLNHVPTFVVKKYEKDIRIGSSQGLYSKNIEEEEDGTKEGNLASYLDTIINYEVENNEQGLHVEECKSEDKIAKEVNVASYDVDEIAKYQGNLEKPHEDFDNKQGINPEDFLKTLEQDGYDLYCPNCEHYITRTVIFRRREDRQQYQTTCFSFLSSLFCCNRWFSEDTYI